MTLKSFLQVMLPLLVPLLFTNIENTTLGLFHKKIISVIGSLPISVSTFHFIIFKFQIIVYTMLTLCLLL